MLTSARTGGQPACAKSSALMPSGAPPQSPRLPTPPAPLAASQAAALSVVAAAALKLAAAAAADAPEVAAAAADVAPTWPPAEADLPASDAVSQGSSSAAASGARGAEFLARPAQAAPAAAATATAAAPAAARADSAAAAPRPELGPTAAPPAVAAEVRLEEGGAENTSMYILFAVIALASLYKYLKNRCGANADDYVMLPTTPASSSRPSTNMGAQNGDSWPGTKSHLKVPSSQRGGGPKMFDRQSSTMSSVSQQSRTSGQSRTSAQSGRPQALISVGR